jgi:metal-responsive CopG/Arc/MetJ family transcriptional regulator
MKKQMVSMTKEMLEALEEERKNRKLPSIPEVVRQILGEYFKAEKLRLIFGENYGRGSREETL